MRYSAKLLVLCTALALVLSAVCLAVWFGYGAYHTIAVRKPNAYAMQSAGQLILEHMRLHSGAWPKNWAELCNTCATTGARILATDAEAEIEELKRRVEIDWNVDPEHLRRSAKPMSVVRLRSGRKDWFVGAEPNQMVWEYLKQATAPDGAANGSQPFHSETNRMPTAAGSHR